MIYLNDRPLSDLVRDLLALDGYQSPTVAVRAALPGANAASVWSSAVTVPMRTVSVGVHLEAATLVARINDEVNPGRFDGQGPVLCMGKATPIWSQACLAPRRASTKWS